MLRFLLPSLTKACLSSSNMYGAQRLLLQWHNKLGHIDFRILQSMAGSRGIPSDIKSCPIPICPSCINGNSLNALALHQIYFLSLLVNLIPVSLFNL